MTFLVPNRCGVRQWHHPRRSLFVPRVQQRPQWGLLPHRRRTDGGHHFPVLHHVDLSNRGLRVSQTVEARSGSHVPREARSRGEAPSFWLDIRTWKWWAIPAIPETHVREGSSHSRICIAFAYFVLIDGTYSRVSTFSVISWGFSSLCVDNYVAEKACEKVVVLWECPLRDGAVMASCYALFV